MSSSECGNLAFSYDFFFLKKCDPIHTRLMLFISAAAFMNFCFLVVVLLNCSPQMEVDGPLSAQEQMIILYDIKLQCQQNLSNTDPGFTGKKKRKAHKHGW